MMDEESEEQLGYDSSGSYDSDAELQKAYAEGRLKPGLNIPVAAGKRKCIKDVAGMEAAYESMYANLDWLQRLDVTVVNDHRLPSLDAQQQQHNVDDIDVNDDFKREMKFYRQGQLAVLDAIPRLHKLNVSTKRPDDYYAEMCKTEKHMKRVREKLVEKKVNIERKEKIKKLRELKKHGKKIQQSILQQRQTEKRELLQSVKKYRKQQQGGGQAAATGSGRNADDDGLAFLNDTTAAKSKGQVASKKANRRRDFKNKKFGFGGRKKGSKHNTADTSASMDTFSVNKHSTKYRGTKGKSKVKAGNKNKKQPRPGKKQRQKMKSGKR